jgi:hypothetical protein
MEIRKGEHVNVNVAPFIGCARPGAETIPCEVIETDGPFLRVRAQPPYRGATMWILSTWIEAGTRCGREMASV